MKSILVLCVSAILCSVMAQHGSKNRGSLNTSRKLISAVKNCSVIEVETLIKNKTNVDTKTISGRPVILIAMLKMSFDCDKIVELLINAGADVNAMDEKNMSPLSYSTGIAYRSQSDPKIARLLIQHGADVNRVVLGGVPVLLLAASNGLDEMVDMFLKNGANVNATDANFDTALHLIANTVRKSESDQRRKVAQLLVNNGANVNARNVKGQTPLHFSATVGGHEEVAEVLIQHGAEIDAHDSLNRTPLCWAIVKNNEKLATLLINNNANVNSVDVSGNSILHFACDAGYQNLVDLLIQHGVNVDAANDEYRPIDLAVINGHEKVVESLLRAGADVNAVVKGHGSTPLHWSLSHKIYPKIVDLLLKNGADVNAIDEHKNTPLHLCVQRYIDPDQRFEAAELLINSRAEINARNVDGKTPLDLVVNERRLLKNYGATN